MRVSCLTDGGPFKTYGGAVGLEPRYWKLSLVVYHDKCTHPEARQAFIKLNKDFKVCKIQLNWVLLGALRGGLDLAFRNELCSETYEGTNMSSTHHWVIQLTRFEKETGRASLS
ncbi:hypothetical protein T459_23476 [Capsicum annuum]|uniref:Uncharacterized protein n=1 Tax=Capsicum annuum TaxID=4072 RepID=A0A2G2YST6_CAPAN|nr:hypothetical protein T459_23476 [Capsicum annuum]